MMKHVEEIHVNNICHIFLNNECKVRKLLSSPNLHNAKYVVNTGTNMARPKTAALSRVSGEA